LFKEFAPTKIFITAYILSLLSSCLTFTPGHEPSSGNTTNSITVNVPIFEPAEGQVEVNTPVTITDSTEGVSIYYTTGNGEPDTLYTEPIVITKTTVIRAIAVKDENTYSEEVSAKYTVLRVSPPVITPLGGETLIGTQVSIETDTLGADIYYTTDGTDPTSLSPLYTDSITITESTTIKAIATKNGYIDSYLVTSVYIIPDSVVAPTFDPAYGEVTKGSTVSLTSTTEGASIYYTTNGGAPTQSSTLYTAPIVINSAVSIKAKAYKTGYPSSAVSSSTYIISQVYAPEFDPLSSTVAVGSALAISTQTGGADVFYTDDGSTPM